MLHFYYFEKKATFSCEEHVRGADILFQDYMLTDRHSGCFWFFCAHISTVQYQYVQYVRVQQQILR